MLTKARWLRGMMASVDAISQKGTVITFEEVGRDAVSTLAITWSWLAALGIDINSHCGEIHQFHTQAARGSRKARTMSVEAGLSRHPPNSTTAFADNFPKKDGVPSASPIYVVESYSPAFTTNELCSKCLGHGSPPERSRSWASRCPR